jgi:transposase
VKNSTARKLEQLPPEVLILGVDPHKRRHVVVAMDRAARVHARFKVCNDRPGFQELIHRGREVATRLGLPGILLAIEAGSHYWRNIAYFLEEDGIPFRLVSPFTLKRRREGEDVNRRKSDYRDAEMAAELVRTGHSSETKLPQGTYAELRAAFHHYRRLVEERTHLTNLARALLSGLFPEFLAVFPGLARRTALAVLSSCSDPYTIRGLAPLAFVAQVQAVFSGQRLQRRKLMTLHRQAGTSVGIAAGREMTALELAHLAARLYVIQDQVSQVEARLGRLLRALPESRYLLSVPGLGLISVAGILAEIGPIEHYRSAKQLVKLAGVNPVEAQSGEWRRRYTPMSKKGRPALRWCLWHAALNLLQKNTEFVAWAQRLQGRPEHQHPLKRRQVLGAATNKLLRLVFALLTKRRLYDQAHLALAA